MSNIIKNGSYLINGLTLQQHNQMLVLRESNNQKKLELEHAERLVGLGQRDPQILDRLKKESLDISQELDKYITIQQKGMIKHV